MFCEEHLHLDDEIRYCVLDSSGYFDVRDKEDEDPHFREKGDMVTLPAGIYHCFVLEEKNYGKALWLFAGEPGVDSA
ncbi:hypothetical protein GH733_009586 [Mirounga leonina]|nr:hypothetical protein GH733_009586 [Mirounga leonina]